ncbi:MAG: hypothetical protein HYY18_06630 [Planctomycetes bacterium]|nr:hypothetical protein [Planctomycetota bacterium]
MDAEFKREGPSTFKAVLIVLLLLGGAGLVAGAVAVGVLVTATSSAVRPGDVAKRFLAEMAAGNWAAAGAEAAPEVAASLESFGRGHPEIWAGACSTTSMSSTGGLTLGWDGFHRTEHAILNFNIAGKDGKSHPVRIEVESGKITGLIVEGKGVGLLTADALPGAH